MPSNKNKPEVVDDLFAYLAQEEPAPEAPDDDPDEDIIDTIAEPPDEADTILTPPSPGQILVRPVPETQLSPEQRRIRDLENQLAQERGRKDPERVVETVDSSTAFIIHVLEDGFTALGQVWYRGQEIPFDPAKGAYLDTFDRHGWSWLSLRNDDNAQINRYGKVMFREGPWPGKSYLDVANETFDGKHKPTAEELAKAQRTEDKRRRTVPRLA